MITKNTTEIMDSLAEHLKQLVEVYPTMLGALSTRDDAAKVVNTVNFIGANRALEDYKELKEGPEEDVVAVIANLLPCEKESMTTLLPHYGEYILYGDWQKKVSPGLIAKGLLRPTLETTSLGNKVCLHLRAEARKAAQIAQPTTKPVTPAATWLVSSFDKARFKLTDKQAIKLETILRNLSEPAKKILRSLKQSDRYFSRGDYRHSVSVELELLNKGLIDHGKSLTLLGNIARKLLIEARVRKSASTVTPPSSPHPITAHAALIILSELTYEEACALARAEKAGDSYFVRGIDYDNHHEKLTALGVVKENNMLTELGVQVRKMVVCHNN